MAIIPARGGSKGIPRKNLRIVAGKPLLVYSIEHALAAPAVTRVIVSTDDPEIRSVARHHRAEVISRPSELSGDAAPSEAALLHTLDYLRETEGYEPALVVFLQATSPLRHPQDIPRAIQTLRRERADSLFSASLVQGFIWRRDNAALASLGYDYQHRPRRQDAPEDLIENGSIYIFKPWILRKFNNRLGGRIAVYRMSYLQSIQVDEPGDLETVERLILPNLPRQAPAAADLRDIRLVVLDFDGVLTDNLVLVNQNGQESVCCSRADGLGLAALRALGVEIFVLSSESTPVVAARCSKLGIPWIQTPRRKLDVLQELVLQKNLPPEQVAYIGNDLNDVECMRWVGLPVAVADAAPELRAVASAITARPGGHGAVREVCDWICNARVGGDAGAETSDNRE